MKNKNETKNEPLYDVAVIGGGIAGAAIARDAVLRGASVILFEKNELGSGASSKSSKLIHGGIRYLELAWIACARGDFSEAWKNFRFVFSSLRESAILEKMAPDLVKPIPLFIPIYGRDTRKPLTIYLGSLLYGLLAFIAGKGRWPRFFLSKKSVLQYIPDLNPEGLQSGVLLWDHSVDDKALVKKTAESARQKGAKILEHSKVTGIRYFFDENRYQITTENHEKFSAQKLLDATGPWIDATRQLLREKEPGDNYLVPIAGSHIELESFLPCSVILQAGDGRLFFVINRGKTARAGTTEWLCKNPDQVLVPDSDIDYLLNSLRFYFPQKNFSRDHILAQDAGIRPLARPRNHQPANQISREHEIRVGHDGVIHVLGVKLTDHRRAAEEIVDELIPELHRKKPEILAKTLTRKIPL